MSICPCQCQLMTIIFTLNNLILNWINFTVLQKSNFYFYTPCLSPSFCFFIFCSLLYLCSPMFYRSFTFNLIYYWNGTYCLCRMLSLRSLFLYLVLSLFHFQPFTPIPLSIFIKLYFYILPSHVSHHLSAEYLGL